MIEPHPGEREVVGLDQEAVVEGRLARRAVVGPAIVPLHRELEAIGAWQRDRDTCDRLHLEAGAVPHVVDEYLGVNAAALDRGARMREPIFDHLAEWFHGS